MSRSSWKGPYIHLKFLKKNILLRSNLKIWSRSSIILSTFVGYKFLIHSGNNFKKFYVTREKIGYKFGEFCTTRQKCVHKNKLKALKTKIKKKVSKKK